MCSTVVGGMITLVAFVLVWFLREVPLSDKSGIQRAAAEKADSAEEPGGEPIPVAVH